MGNDGGSIPKRRELVKEAARQQTSSQIKETQQEAQAHKWSTCQISQRPLKAPIVSDCLGNLYNKDAILEFLLPSEDPAVEALKPDQERILEGRVKGLKDVVEVRFLEDGEEKASGGEGRWVCPVTNKALGPAVKAAYVVPCGHAFAEVALREVADSQCLQCNEPYSTEDIVTILPLAEEDRMRLKERIGKLAEKGQTHALKKASRSKKRKKNSEAKEGEVTSGMKNGAPTTQVAATISKKANGIATPASTNGIKNAATASLTARVLAEEQEKAKRRKLDRNDNLKSLFSSKEKDGTKGRNTDFMTRGFSIPAGAKR